MDNIITLTDRQIALKLATEQLSFLSIHNNLDSVIKLAQIYLEFLETKKVEDTKIKNEYN